MDTLIRNLLGSLVFLIVGAAAGASDWSSRNSFDFGMTTNANLSKELPVSDSFARATTSNTVPFGSQTLGLRLSYIDYFQQSQNDALSLRLSDIIARPGSRWKYSGALVSQTYTSGNPGITDYSFTNAGFDLGAARDSQLNGPTGLEIGGGYRFRSYPSFSHRNDHTLFGAGTLDFEVSEKISAGTTSELGLMISTLPEYTRIYFELGGSLDWDLPSQWEWSNDLLLSMSSFPGRTVTATTVVTQKRGGSSKTLTGNESYSLFSFSSEIFRKQTETLKWGFGLYMTNQSSRSGYQDYSTTQALARLILSF
jgi:hypothetical protein